MGHGALPSVALLLLSSGRARECPKLSFGTRHREGPTGGCHQRERERERVCRHAHKPIRLPAMTSASMTSIVPRPGYARGWIAGAVWRSQVHSPSPFVFLTCHVCAPCQYRASDSCSLHTVLQGRGGREGKNGRSLRRSRSRFRRPSAARPTDDTEVCGLRLGTPCSCLRCVLPA